MRDSDRSIERRAFLKVLGLLGGEIACPSLLRCAAELNLELGAATPKIETLTPHVFIFRDVVNAAVIERNGRALIINPGRGAAIDALRARGVDIDWALYTSYEREHSLGAPFLKSHNVQIGVPAAEAILFRHASEFWRDVDFDHRYDFRPDFSVLRSSANPDRELSPGDIFHWQGLAIEVLGTPGTTDGGLSFLVQVDGQKIAFTGNLIESAGRFRNFYKLQKPFSGMAGNILAGRGGYWGFGGAVPELKRSLATVQSKEPALLVPSHGEIIRNPNDAIASLGAKLDAVMRNYLTLAAWRVYFGYGDVKVSTDYEEVAMLPSLPEPKLPSWFHQLSLHPLESAYPLIPTSWYIQAEDGSIFLFDCGFPPVAAVLAQRVKDGAIKNVDGIWISHYHDDHVASVNEVRRTYGAKVYAQRELKDILENPTAYEMPCLFPESIRVDDALAEGQVIEWKGFKLTGYYFPGQTLYHGGLLVEHEGTRLFLCGDSIANFGLDDYCAYNRNFLGSSGPGYQRCLRLLLDLRPDLLVAAHFGSTPFAAANLTRASELLNEREKLFSQLLPWDDPNFGLDPYWVSAYPFRQKVLPGEWVSVQARVFNHSSLPKRVTARLRADDEWGLRERGAVLIPPHREGFIPLIAQAPTTPQARRDVLGIDVSFDGKDMGEAAVAIVDYLS